MKPVSCILKPSIAVEQFEASGLESILAIERASFGRDAWPKKAFLEYFQHCHELFFIARRGNKIAGYIITCTSSRIAELVSIAVDPQYRRQGIAQALLDRTKAELTATGYKTLWLMVSMENESAIAFYEQYGFATTRRTKHYYGTGHDAWRMRLSL